MIFHSLFPVQVVRDLPVLGEGETERGFRFLLFVLPLVTLKGGHGCKY